jgi:hypothetical protein
MDPQDLRRVEDPLKERYREEPEAASPQLTVDRIRH